MLSSELVGVADILGRSINTLSAALKCDLQRTPRKDVQKARVCDLSLVRRSGADLLPDPEEVAAHDLTHLRVAEAVRKQRLRNRLKVRILAEF